MNSIDEDELSSSELELELEMCAGALIEFRKSKLGAIWHFSRSSSRNSRLRFGISEPYASRLFKKHIGKGLKRYMIVRKIGHAKKLLDGGSTVTETCFACGFNDCSYFIKVFKSYTGVTPYKYQLLSKNHRME